MDISHDKRLSRSEQSINSTDIESTVGESVMPPTPTSPSTGKTRNVSRWRDLFAFTKKRHIVPLGAALFVSTAAGAVGPALSIFLGKLFNTLSEFAQGDMDKEHFRSVLSKDSLLLALIGLLSFLFGGGSSSTWMAFGELQARTCREEVFDGLLDKPVEWYDTRRSGVQALVARLNTQVRELQLALSQPMCAIFHGIATTLASLVVAMVYCWSLTLVVLASAPITALILSFVSSRMQPHIESQVKAMEEASKIAIGAFASIETVKLFNGQEVELAKYLEPLRAAHRFYLKQVKINMIQNGFATFMTYTIFVQGFWYGSHLVSTGKESAGTIVTTFFSALTAAQAIQAVLPQFQVMEKGRAAGTALRLLADSFLQDTQADTMTVPEICLGQIEFRNVTFSYPARPMHAVLKEVSCFFPAFQTVFVIGESGSGKSTLAQLLLNFYQPQAGAILLDGQTLSETNTRWLRDNITLVEQYSTLFQGSIAENIALGGGSIDCIDLESVHLAAQFALVKQTFNELPDGFDTLLTSDNSLSGGQRQRMALARARLRDTPVVFFDESTSSLDQASRSLVMSAIRLWRNGKTTIFISHDLAQIEPDDFIYLFEDGRVTDQGSKRELESTSEPFARYLKRPQKPKLNNLQIGSRTDNGSEAVQTGLQHWSDHHTSVYHGDSPVETKQQSKLGKLLATQARRDTYIPFSMRSPILSPKQFEFASFPNFAPKPERATQMPLPAVEDEDNMAKRRSKRISYGFGLLQTAGDLAKSMRANPSGTQRRRIISDAALYPFGNATADNFDHKDYILPVTEILRTVWPTLSTKLRICLVIAFCNTAIHAGATPAFAYIFSKLFSTLYQKTDSTNHDALTMSIAIIAIGVTDAVAVMFERYLFELCGQTWVDHYRSEAMKHILAQPRQFFLEERNSPGELTQALDRYAEEMKNLLGRFCAIAVTAVIMITLATVWSLVTCWKLALVGMSLTPASFVIGWVFAVVAARMEAQSNDAAETAGGILSEVCSSVKTVRALTLEEHFHRKFFSSAQRVVQVGVRRALYDGFFFGLSEAIPDFVTAILFYYGGLLLLSGNYDLEQINTVFSMLLFTMTNIGLMIEFIPQVSSSRDTASRLIYLARLPLVSHEDTGTIQLTTIGDIAVKNVTFAYDSRPEQPVLSNVSMKFPAGSITALVGFSGSGKSTIASLLMRLYHLKSSPDINTTTSDLSILSHHTINAALNITISRRSLNNLHTSTLRNLITLVAQTPTLFPGTIASNICYGLPEASLLRQPASLHSAARAAGIHDLIASLPQGYETLVGDGGLALSGGQTQRLCIARALVRRPKVLILDEATSALDSESARRIRETIVRLKRERRELTVIVITHSVEMMEMCERVVMMERGEVVEEGGWEELMNGRGRKGRRLRELVRGGVWEGEEGGGRKS